MNTNVVTEENLHICIAARAYEIFEHRDRAPGHDAEDCARAEAEVRHHFGLPPSSQPTAQSTRP